MNETDDPPIDSGSGPLLFDRLVDGALSEAQRRELLAGLDSRPDGWRQCALAFLEAQSWGDELGRMVRDPSGAREPSRAAAIGAVRPTRVEPTGKPIPRFRRWQRPLMMAASFLVTFSLGMGLQQWWPNSGDSTTNLVAVHPPATTNPPGANADVRMADLNVRDARRFATDAQGADHGSRQHWQDLAARAPAAASISRCRDARSLRAERFSAG